MTAAGDSTCSQLKQDTHILRLKFQIFSIKKRCAHGTRLTLTLFLGRTREIWDDCTRVYSRHSIGSAAGATSGGVKRRRTDTCTGPAYLEAQCLLLRMLLAFLLVCSSSWSYLFFCVLCVSILFQMSCVCMRTKTTTATTTTTTTKDKTRQKRQRKGEREREANKN